MRPYLPYLAFALALLAISSQIVVPPIVGLADNGDFGNVAGPFRLMPSPPEMADRYFTHVIGKWRIDPSQQPFLRLLSSELLLAAPFALLAHLVPGGLLDIRVIGAIHAAIFLFALWLLAPAFVSLRKTWQSIVLAALVVFVFCDAAYVTHFNTFYMDAAALAFFSVLVALYVRMRMDPKSGRTHALLVAAAAFLFVTAKVQHALLAPFLAGFWLTDAGVRRALPAASWRYGVALAMLAGATAVFLHVPEDYRASAAYNVVFEQLMPVDRDRVMEEFELPVHYLALSGTNAYSEQSGLRSGYFHQDVIQRVNHRRLLLYYLRHPEVIVRLIRMALVECAFERPVGFGNFTAASKRPPRAESTFFDAWSDAKRSTFSYRPWLYAGFALIVMAAAAWAARRFYPPAWRPVLLLILCTVFEFLVSAVGDVEETTRHLFFFRFLLDLLLVLAVACILLHQPAKARPAK